MDADELARLRELAQTFDAKHWPMPVDPQTILRLLDALEAAQEQRGTLIAHGSLSNPQYTPAGEMIRSLEAERDVLRAVLRELLDAAMLMNDALDGEFRLSTDPPDEETLSLFRRAEALATPSAPKEAT